MDHSLRQERLKTKLEILSTSYSKPAQKLTFEEILDASGGFGAYQFLILVGLLFAEIPAAFVAFSPVFFGKPPSQWMCQNGNETNILTDYEEICGCPPENLSSIDSSIVSEWSLICGSSWVSDFITSIQMLGMVLGSLFSSQLSDWYGRKWVYFGVCVLMAVGQVLSGLASTPVIFSVARFIAGAGLSGFLGMSTIYPLEFMTPNRRLLIGSVGPWGEGIMLHALLAYFVPNWRDLLVVSSLPFLFVVIMVPFIPESPRWLIRNGKISEALEVVKSIQRTNGKAKVKVTYSMLEDMWIQETQQPGEQPTERFSYLDFFRDSQLRKKTLLLMGIWFSWSIVYFGLSYNAKNLRGDIRLNVFFMGLSDALGYPAALLINNKLGRRKSLVVFMSLATLFLATLAILDLSYGALVSAFTVSILSLCGKFGVAGARSALRMLTGESFPTAIRTMGYGISVVTAGVGGIIAPQIAFLGAIWWSPLPFVTFAFISIAGSLLSLLLPETAGTCLQESTGLVPKVNSPRKSATTTTYGIAAVA